MPQNNETHTKEQRKLVLNAKYYPLWTNKTARYFIITGGRGSGKSFATGTFVCDDFVNRELQKNSLYLRQTLVSAHISIIPEFTDKIELLGYNGFVRRGKTDIKNIRNNSMLYFRGIQTSRGSNEANLKSITNVCSVFIDEAQELVDEKQFDRIDFSIRDNDVQNRVIISLNPTDWKHWIYTRFFQKRGIPDDFNGVDPRYPDTCYIHTDYRDNIENLPKSFLDLAENCRVNDPEKYRNIFLGFWAKENVNALWKKQSMIDPFRIGNLATDLERIVIGVDPSVTSKDNSDLTGIVAAGMAKNPKTGEMEYYVLEDKSMRASPNEWAKAVIDLYMDYDADRVIGEVNNGGDLIESLLRRFDPSVSYMAVRATRGKILRAEPIASLYERGLVHHVGTFPELEDQMCSFVGADGEKSPDRLDALVWALTELSGNVSAEPEVGEIALSY